MAEEKEARLQSKLQFHYIKGAEYRETPCHGAVGERCSQSAVDLCGAVQLSAARFQEWLNMIFKVESAKP